MTKLKFLLSLHEKLSDLPQIDVEERLNFYSEMIEDRIEEGLSEEDAVSAVGNVDEIAAQIIADIALNQTTNKDTQTNQHRKAWVIVLLALGSPIWICLLIAVLAVILSLIAVLWSVVISLWAAFGSLAGCTLGGLVAGIVFTFAKNGPTGLAFICAAMVCAGLSIFQFYGCKAATKGAVFLTKKIAKSIQKCFTRKENA